MAAPWCSAAVDNILEFVVRDFDALCMVQIASRCKAVMTSHIGQLEISSVVIPRIKGNGSRIL